MIRVCITAVIVLAACRGGEDKAARGSATGSAGSAGSATSSASAAGSGSAAAATPEMRAFCLRSMQHIQTCFEDAAFWDAHATTFFAAQKQPIDPERKQHWIGMYKDSYVTLARDKELEQNCDAMLAQNQLPTQQQIDLVDQAREQSCAAFGGALGYVLFSEGAFHKPRDGSTPAKLELAPTP